jgi:putative ABC transport system ATP-binding protein
MTATTTSTTTGSDRDPSGGHGYLVAEPLHKSFGPTRALAGAEVCISQGELVAVMGPSGSGKSTLLHCLAGIIQPDEGRVVYAGRDVTALDDAARSALRRTDFGFVFQFAQLVPELTCEENIAMPLRLDRVRRRRAREKARQWLARFDLEEVAGKRPGEVSGGQAQRVAVARALIAQPRVVFADEPTGAVDSYNSELVMSALTEAARATGATVVLVTHDARTAAYADREIIVRDGKVSDPELMA